MANQMANRKMTLIADISDGTIKIPTKLQKHFPPFGKCQMEVENDKIIIRNIQKNEDEIVAETIQKASKLLYKYRLLFWECNDSESNEPVRRFP